MARTSRLVTPADEGAREFVESRDPSTGELVGTVPATSPEEVEHLAAEVATRQPAWAARPAAERAGVIRRAAQVLLDRSEEIALAVTRETGKTLTEATATDVGAPAMVLDWIGRHGYRYLLPERLRTPQLILKHKRNQIRYEPLGVIGVISAWNYPVLVPSGPVASALVAGNGVVLKPSEYTPLVGELLLEVFTEAGLPDGVLGLVHGEAATGAALCRAPSIAKICFTGSVEVGLQVMRLAAEHGKPVILELGGKDPAIVCQDADLDRAVAVTAWAGLAGAGQTCAAVERVYVDRTIYHDYVQRMVATAERIQPGDPKDPITQLGSVTTEPQYRRVIAHIDDAVAKGARVECGGPVQPRGLSGRFIAPVLLTGVDHSMSVMQEETFGPVIPVMAFDTEDEAVELANESKFGLGASVWSRDLRRARGLARRLDAGMVWINDHGYSAAAAQAPWSGTKSSGQGVIHSRFGLYEMVHKRLVSEDRGWLPLPWAYPYDDERRRGFVALLQTVYAPGFADKIRAAYKHRRALAGFARGLARSRTRPRP